MRMLQTFIHCILLLLFVLFVFNYFVSLSFSHAATNWRIKIYIKNNYRLKHIRSNLSPGPCGEESRKIDVLFELQVTQ